MKIEKILSAENIADELDEEHLEKIGMECFERYESDRGSRRTWEKTMENSLKLALQVYDKKNTPWTDASNVKFPSITIPAIQFNARMFPALTQGVDLIRHRTIGPDPTGEKNARAERVSAHMSYQLLEEDENWLEEEDKMLMALPILGCAFKKTYFDSEKQHIVGSYVSPENLIVNYYATSLEDAECITERIGYVSERELTERQRLGIYRDVELDHPIPDSEFDKTSKERQGLTSPSVNNQFSLLEQHCYLDLDDDGYEEPYIVTLDETSHKVLRIIPRFDEEDIVMTRNGKSIAKIFPEHYYTKYKFIPSPDGGFYELGFGVLLGPINEAINTILNQLIDAGTLSNMQGGIVGSGARLKKGDWRFKPGEWKQVNATGDDIRKAIIPLPVREPSATLFNLLNLLIEYGERTSSVSDMMVGKTPGQNTPATTSMASLEQGQKVFGGIHTRIYGCATKEYRRRYQLNAKYLNPQEYFQIVEGDDQEIFQEDYQGDPTDIRPNADPTISSDQQRIARAQALKELSSQSPLYNPYEVEKRVLKALHIPAIDQVLPAPGSENAMPPPEPPLKDQALMMKTESEIQMKADMMPMEMGLIDAQIAEIETKMALNLAKAEAADEKTTIDSMRVIIDDIRATRDEIKEKRKEHEQRSVQRVEGKS